MGEPKLLIMPEGDVQPLHQAAQGSHEGDPGWCQVPTAYLKTAAAIKKMMELAKDYLTTGDLISSDDYGENGRCTW